MDTYDTQMDESLEYSRVLSEVEREIVSAFTAHFAGKPGQYVPALRCAETISGYTEVGQKVTDAIESVHDYPEVLETFHAVIRGLRPLADYQHAVMQRYLKMNAADIAERRSGISAPLSYVAPSIPAFLTEASHV